LNLAKKLALAMALAIAMARLAAGLKSPSEPDVAYFAQFNRACNLGALMYF